MMQVTCGADWLTSGGGRRSYSLSLDKDDLKEIKGVDFVENLDPAALLKALNKMTESLVVAYLGKEGGMGEAEAARRIARIQQDV